MIKLNKPVFDQGKVIEDCISNMHDASNSTKRRIIASKSEICNKSDEYDRLAIEGNLYTLSQDSKLFGGASREDMIKLYTQKFSRIGEEARYYYDKIMSLVPYNTCPFCGHRKVQTLDHYLPKSKFPVYAITPFNLIPACSDCNKLKSVEVFNRFTDQTIHPYYDDFTDEVWIKAKLIEEEPISFEYYVDRPENWDRSKFERAKKHFDSFELNELYKSHAAEEFQGCLHRVEKLFRKGGKNLAIEHLEESIEEKTYIRLNTWQAAMYEAMIQSDWFWDEYLPSTL